MDILEGELLLRWNELHAKLTKDGSWALAGLFKGHIPDGYSVRSQRILYIGKATAGPLADENANEKYFNKLTAGFWSFARELSRLADCKCEDLGNLVWSNLCKIGVSKGNPNEALADEQLNLAVRTLQHENTVLKPTLIVCVAEGFQDRFLYKALGVGDNGGFGWRQSGELFLYFRSARDGWPPILWMKHPQFKNKSYLDEGLEIAADLIAGREVRGTYD